MSKSAEKAVLIEISIKIVDASRVMSGDVVLFSKGPPTLDELKGIISDLSPDIIKKADNKGNKRPKKVLVRKKVH